jgi:hypothetical protein
LEKKELIKILQTKYTSIGGFLGVNIDNVKTIDDLFENIKDEILTIEDILENSDIVEEEGYYMTTNEAKSYVKKLKNFLLKYDKQLGVFKWEK